MPNVNAVLAKIAKARSQHTDAETAIFEAYILGEPLSQAVPFVEDLIEANNDLSAALTELLKELG